MRGLSWFNYLRKNYNLDSNAVRKNVLRGLAQGERKQNGNHWQLRQSHQHITEFLGPLAVWDTSEALCKELDLRHFFGEGSWKKAIKICERCPIKTECLNFAITYGIKEGIWGGKTSTERGYNENAHIHCRNRLNESRNKVLKNHPHDDDVSHQTSDAQLNHPKHRNEYYSPTPTPNNQNEHDNPHTSSTLA
jgi:WhiB family redox-sensing transcriptional regulator